MGLILVPAEIKTNMVRLSSYLESVAGRYQNVRERVYEYCTNEELNTESFEKSKNQMEICYRLIAEGMIAVQERVMEDIDMLLGCIGDEELNEDALKAQIKWLQQQCEVYEGIIEKVSAMQFDSTKSSAAGLINIYHARIEKMKEKIAILTEKLIFLHEAEDLTANLFESAIDLLTAVQNAIADGGVNVRTDNGFAGELAWLNNLDVMKGLLVPPKPGDTITVSRGVDSKGNHKYEKAVVSKWNAWSIEYSISACNSEYSDQLCSRRLNYAVENYKCNKNDNDLLMFSLEGYDDPVFAGAMVDGYADIGDIVRITLDDGTDFNFLILDVKHTEHTIEQLAEKAQCQCEWGHGYMREGGKVQLSVCEFMTAGDYSIDSAIEADSGKFLLKRSVVRAQIVDSIKICDEPTEDNSQERRE